MKEFVKTLWQTIYCAVISAGSFYSDTIVQELTYHTEDVSFQV